MRRSARVQALETIKRRKLSKLQAEGSHVTSHNTPDHVTQHPSPPTPADNATTVVGQNGQSGSSDGSHAQSTHVTTSGPNGHDPTSAGSNGHQVTTNLSATDALPPQQFRTTRAQAKLLSQQRNNFNAVLIPQTDLRPVNSHMTPKLDQFKFSQKAKVQSESENTVKIEDELESYDLSRDIKAEEKSAYFIKTEPVIPPLISDIEECHTFAAPQEFNVQDNPEVLSQPGPRGWGTIYARVKKMRALVNAPVDTMGCERLVQDGVPAKVQRFQLLISLMLSSQTKDEVTCQAVLNLREFLKSRDLLLSVDGILSMSVGEIDGCISKVGFHNRKADYISRATALLVKDFGGDIPPTIAAMTSLPGVGPKMAHLLMHRAWGVNEGIGVDVHVHRLANMWGWVKGKTPEESRVQLEKWLPQELWVDINPTLVGFGQTVCPSKGKKCGVCIVDKGLCKARLVKGLEWKEEKWMKEGYRKMMVEYEGVEQ
ncbi:YALIA101S02e20472g1_1 [Yarrowia lipolytica]|nr:Endonuclease III [Yarrowia lipolytica]SEI32561.1 YALIA101S02e20472g1_1 [Yarrowia lipolytica]